MAKIDTSQIEGYAEMSPEEKVKALEAFQYEDLTSEVERYKNAVSKANSEAADWKKKYNSLLSEEEQNKIAKEEEMDTIKAELDKLKKEKGLADNRAKFIALGYDDKLATDTATALMEGDTEKVFANQKTFMEIQAQKLRAEIMGGTPRPPAGGSDPQTTKEELQKMTPQERYTFYQENPEIYKEIYGGNE
jgi:molybdopterin converting factor small subunit